jgi:peptidoglycan/LPS O-acetylase OafA/YrhL
VRILRQTMLRSLRRITTSGKYVPEIDGLRFVAIASVVLYHIERMTEIHYGTGPAGTKLTSIIMAPIFHGGTGVSVFFVISGMVLGLPFVRWRLDGGHAVSLKAYFLRRVTRLEPPYVGNLFIRLPFIASAKGMAFLAVLPHFLASLFYLHGLIYGAWPLVHQPSWSLEIEVQFYLIAPFLAWLVYRGNKTSRRVILLGLIIAMVLIQNRIPLGYPRYQFSVLSSAQFFLAGFLLADLYVFDMAKWRASWVWDVVGMTMWVAVFSASKVWLPFIILLACISAFKGPLINRCMRNAFVATVGGMCYSIYLTHSLALQGAYALFSRVHFIHGFYPHLWIGAVLILPVLLVIGTGFYVLIERPCMDRSWPAKMRARFVHRQTAHATA